MKVFVKNQINGLSETRGKILNNSSKFFENSSKILSKLKQNPEKLNLPEISDTSSYAKTTKKPVLGRIFRETASTPDILFLTPIIWNKSLCVYTGNKATLVAQPILQKTLNILPPHTNHHIVSCLSFNCRYGL